MGRKNKYNKFPPRINVKVGERCDLRQCCRQVRKDAQKQLNHKTAYFTEVFEGLNNETGEMEQFVPICSVNNYLTVKRIK